MLYAAALLDSWDGMLKLNISDKVVAGVIANGCFVQGEIVESAGSLEIAIAGEGCIPFLKANGKTVYTRYGSFGMNKTGFLNHGPSGLPISRS